MMNSRYNFLKGKVKPYYFCNVFLHTYENLIRLWRGAVFSRFTLSCRQKLSEYRLVSQPTLLVTIIYKTYIYTMQWTPSHAALPDCLSTQQLHADRQFICLYFVLIAPVKCASQPHVFPVHFKLLTVVRHSDGIVTLQHASVYCAFYLIISSAEIFCRCVETTGSPTSTL